MLQLAKIDFSKENCCALCGAAGFVLYEVWGFRARNPSPLNEINPKFRTMAICKRCISEICEIKKIVDKE